jgi:tRNA (mo5U34)-methyltransferase
VFHGEVLPLPTDEAPSALEKRLTSHGGWFYRYSFVNGVSSDPPDPVTQAIHDQRARLVFPELDRIIGDRWGTTRCVDVACHEGWFSMQLAARSAARVVGFDIRAEHIKKANVIREISGLGNVTFDEADLFALDPTQIGSFDVTLFLGLLYHLDNPVGALRAARSLTTQVCVLETQVARPTPRLECLWGSGEARSGPGIAVVPSDDVHVQGGREVALVPTLEALLDLLTAVGFRDAKVLGVSGDGHPQFVDGDRVVVFAFA